MVKGVFKQWNWCPGRSLIGARGLAATLLVLPGLLAGCAEEVAVAPEQASPARVRLLTADQYQNTIAQVFGDDIGESVIPPMPPLQRTEGLLASGAASVGLTSDQVSQIQLSATTIAELVVDEDHRDFLVGCEPADALAPDESCAADFLSRSGRLLFRRPVSEQQLESLTALAVQAATDTEDFYGGLALALEMMLISPEFLFIVDSVEDDPNHPGSTRLDAFALASRLSYFLWNTAPDEALLRAAEDGSLHDPDVLAAQAERMLASDRLEAGMRAFFDDMLAFDEFDSLTKDPLVYPTVTGATLADAREQTLRTILHHLIEKEADYRDLFTTREMYMSMSLAALYGTPARDGWELHEFPEGSDRTGLLTQVSFLAANSHTVRSSPTLRGKAMRELFLCQHVPDPPPNVDFSGIEDAGDVATARERLKVHNTNPSCAGCHLITDPMGLSLELFDGAGIYRETENGADIDIRGELDGVFYDDVPGLASAMRNHPKLSYCLVNRLYAYGTGGPLELKYDRSTLKWFEGRFVEADYKLPALLQDLVTSDAFARVREHEEMEIAESSPAINHVAEARAKAHGDLAARFGLQFETLAQRVVEEIEKEPSRTQPVSSTAEKNVPAQNAGPQVR